MISKTQKSETLKTVWNDASAIVDTPSVSVQYDPSVNEALDDSCQVVMRQFANFLKELAENDTIDTEGISVYPFEDFEEKVEIVFSIQVKASPENAMAFWNRVGSTLEEWLSKQPKNVRDTIRDKFAFDVRW